MLIRLRLLGRQDCELCAELYAALMHDDRVVVSGLEVIDIESAPALLAIHLYRVPVLFDGEREIYAGRLDLIELATALDTAFKR